MTSLKELLPKLHELPRADKLRLIQLMVVDLAREEGVPLIEADQSFPVWSPHNAFSAAETLLEAVGEEASG